MKRKPTPADASACPVATPDPIPAPESPTKPAKPTPQARSKRRDPVKTRVKTPATPKAWELRRKLEALAIGGVNGEKTAAEAKLARLLARVDFSKPMLTTPDLFAGVFITSSVASPVATFMPENYDIAAAVKWAIEAAAHVPCIYRGGQLCAQADPPSARRLQSIADTITEAFGRLWGQYRAAPGVNPADRANFILGLSEGVMREERSNEKLPTRAGPTASRGRVKRKAMAMPAGLQIHPYSAGASLGKGLRFCVPVETLSGELESKIKGQIEAKPLTTKANAV